MRKPIAPCRNCSHATGGCKLQCDRYRAYEKAWKEYSALVRKNKLRQANKYRQGTTYEG